MRRLSYPILSGYVALNLLFVFVPIFRYAIPEVMTLNPLAIHDLALQRSAVRRYIAQGVPYWLVAHHWLRSTRMAHEHPQVMSFLREFPGQVGVVSNVPRTFFYTDIRDPTPAFLQNREPVGFWFHKGTCTPQDDVAVVLVRWYDTPEDLRAFAELVEQKCPGLPRATLGEDIVYRLDATIPAYAQALDYAQQGRWEDAIAIYNRALALNPDSVRAYADRGRAYAALGDFDQALGDFDQALARMPAWEQLQREREQVRAHYSAR